MPNQIDIERVLELLILDAMTGTLTWRASRGPEKAGSVAGTLHPGGYISVGIDGKYYLAHRIVWAMHYHKEPPAMLDHINGDRSDNRPCNLRAATHAENNRNKRKYSSSTSGTPGVSWSKWHGKWYAHATLHGKRHHGGYFSDKSEAIAKVKAMRLELHGQFAAQLGALA